MFSISHYCGAYCLELSDATAFRELRDFAKFPDLAR